jgi:hypothetical protein
MARKWKRTTTSPWLGGSVSSRTESWIKKRARNPRIAGSLCVLSAYGLEAVQDALAVGALH